MAVSLDLGSAMVVAGAGGPENVTRSTSTSVEGVISHPVRLKSQAMKKTEKCSTVPPS